MKKNNSFTKLIGKYEMLGSVPTNLGGGAGLEAWSGQSLPTCLLAANELRVKK